MSSACPPAFRIFVSISASASVVKRMAFAVVCRCTKVSASGGFSIRSACVAGRLDEVAEHVVVPDLQRVHPGLRHILGLHPGDHPAPLVAQPPRLVELLVIARRHEAAVAHEKRRLGDQRRVEQPEQRLLPGQRRPRRRQHLRQLLRQRRTQPPGLRQRIAHRREVARPAAVERQPRQRPLEVGHPAQQLAHRAGERRRLVEAPPPRRPAPGSGRASVDGPVSRVSSSRAPPPVTVRSIVASSDPSRPPARLRVSSRFRRVAASIAIKPAGPLPHRRPQERQPPALGQLEIVDDRAERPELGPAEAPEPVDLARPERRRHPRLGGARIEARPRQRRRHRARLGDDARAARTRARRRPAPRAARAARASVPVRPAGTS